MSIERILEKNGIEYKKGNAYYQIRCLSPEHEDNNPSMFVNKYTGWANCRSCGSSYNIFTLFNEAPNMLQMRKEKFKQLLQKTAASTTYLEFPSTSVFWRDSYRGISANTIKKFQGFQCAEHPGYLFFPIKNGTNKITNFIGRDTTGNRQKYMLYSNKPIIMYPQGNSRLGSIIIVEGIFDLMNLYDKGVRNARAIFGAQNFSKETISRIKLEDVDEVVLMLDGDEAGSLAAKNIKEMLDEEHITNKVVKLPKGTDPGDLSQKTVDKIMEKLYGKNSYNRDEALEKQL